MDIAPPVISIIRHQHLPVSTSRLIRMHEGTAISVSDFQEITGDRRTRFRLSSAQGWPKPIEGDEIY